ncbi:hypothetical protein Y032_0011g1336 [Ancylostoma ceylanicum]|nr:hypothetical protein Y032_0011g1336 [Ancylostoma ceylanicum]
MRRGCAARAGILSGTTNYGDFLIVTGNFKCTQTRGETAARPSRAEIRGSACGSACLFLPSENLTTVPRRGPAPSRRKFAVFYSSL